METKNIFPKGQKVEANFTGTAWVEILSVNNADFDTQVYNVTFEPGCRNYWHSHPGKDIIRKKDSQFSYLIRVMLWR